MEDHVLCDCQICIRIHGVTSQKTHLRSRQRKSGCRDNELQERTVTYRTIRKISVTVSMLILFISSFSPEIFLPGRNFNICNNIRDFYYLLFLKDLLNLMALQHEKIISTTFEEITLLFLTFVGPCIVIYFYSKTNQIHIISNLFYFGTTLYMFRTVVLSIITRLRLYIQHQVYVIQVLYHAIQAKSVHTATGICHTGPVSCCTGSVATC
jgi:hypothetical protein